MSIETQVDVRDVPKPERHPLILAKYGKLRVGESILLMNDHDPKNLRDDFEREMPGSYSWEYRERGPDWRVLITKLAATPLPRVIGDTSALDTADASTGGAVWKLEHTNRDLDSNLIRLPAGGWIEEYAGPDIDVLIVFSLAAACCGRSWSRWSLGPASSCGYRGGHGVASRPGQRGSDTSRYTRSGSRCC